MYSGFVCYQNMHNLSNVCLNCIYFYDPCIILSRLEKLQRLCRPSPGPLYSDQLTTEILHETCHASGSLHFAGSHIQFPQNWGKYSATNIGQIAIRPFVLQMLKCSPDDCVINNLVCHHFDKSEQ